MMLTSILIVSGMAFAQQPAKKGSSYSPVVITEDLGTITARMKGGKPAVMKRHMDLLNERYDLNNRPAKGVTMVELKLTDQEKKDLVAFMRAL